MWENFASLQHNGQDNLEQGAAIVKQQRSDRGQQHELYPSLWKQFHSFKSATKSLVLKKKV